MITKTIYDCVLAICYLLGALYFLRAIQTIWLRYIDKREQEKREAAAFAEAVQIHERKKEIMDKQEKIRMEERKHEIALNSINNIK